jgi:hypothetical protein
VGCGKEVVSSRETFWVILRSLEVFVDVGKVFKSLNSMRDTIRFALRSVILASSQLFSLSYL